jgi:hypothetical protein
MFLDFLVVGSLGFLVSRFLGFWVSWFSRILGFLVFFLGFLVSGSLGLSRLLRFSFSCFLAFGVSCFVLNVTISYYFHIFCACLCCFVSRGSSLGLLRALVSTFLVLRNKP